MKWQVEFARFTPREAEKITGVSTSLQRDWRRREVLPPTKGHARFNVLELSWLLGTKLLSEKGVGPEHTKEVMDILASGITQFALQNIHAFEGNVPSIQSLPTDENTRQQIALLEEKILQKGAGSDQAMLSAWNSAIGPHGIVQHAMSELDGWKGIGRVAISRYFIWFADGTHTWHYSVSEAMKGDDKHDFVRKNSGPVIVIDQYQLGRMLREQVSQPLVSVNQLEEDSTGSLGNGAPVTSELDS